MLLVGLIILEIDTLAMSLRERRQHRFTTGTYPTPREAGALPDTLDVLATDVSDDNAFCSCLHKIHGFGRFEVPILLEKALGSLHSALTQANDEDIDKWTCLCERGALLFLQHVLLEQGIGIPQFEWKHATPRTCTRFGEGFAPFAHTDLRIGSRRLYNIWVPVDPDVISDPLLLLHLRDADCTAFCAASDKAHHLPAELSERGEWFFFDGMRQGHVLIFPGDGGEDGSLFHAAAVPGADTGGSGGTAARATFDVRELVASSTRPAAEDFRLEPEWVSAATRLANEHSEWTSDVLSAGGHTASTGSGMATMEK